MPRFDILQISQLPLPHEKLPRSASSINLNFERTNLSRNVFELQKSIHGGLGNTAFLAQVTFVHADAFSLIHQKQYLTPGEKSILG